MKTLAKILIAFLSVVIVAGVVIMVLVFTKDNGFKIKLEEEGVTVEQLEFSATGLEPGKEKGYSIQLNAKSEGNYSITLAFDGEEGVLSDVLNVRIEYVGGKINENLSDLLNGKTIDFSCNVSKNTKISIIYVMPAEAGNEVQGAVADFKVILTAERQ